MSKNEKVTENKEQTEQKVMTKYDRKVQKRKEEKEKEKKEERISTAIGIVAVSYTHLDVYKRQVIQGGKYYGSTTQSYSYEL